MTRPSLIIASNDLGNPADFPPRSIEAIRSADILIFEEHRRAREALKKSSLHTNDYWIWNENSRDDVLKDLRKEWQQGKSVVYMSDQGLANVCDPGAELIALAQSMDVGIDLIPGPSSISCALALYPKKIDRYLFVGFLHRESAKRSAELQKLATTGIPLVILDTPYRLSQVLKDCRDTLGKERSALLVMEIGNPGFQRHYQTLGKLADKVDSKKDNFVLVVDGH